VPSEPQSRILTKSSAADPLERLQQLSSLAAEAGARTASTDASLLAERTEQGLFYVACVGQFKRGKSTLLNALVNAPVLPTGVVPVTSVVTVLRHGVDRRARVRFSSGEWRAIDPLELSAYVSEDQNPGNEKGVLAAEVFLPHPLFATGLCLVDTPGLGSVFEANTETTRSFVPHIDAALVVLGADPPISGEELSLVEEVARSVSHLLFVLNKADRLSEEERRDARKFAERVLEKRLGRAVGPILEVAAAESLAAGHPTRELSTLEESLETLAREASADLIACAQARGLERLGRRVLAVLEEQREALERPLEESERRVEALQRSVAEAERAALDLAYLFTAEQNRLSEAFTQEKEGFLTRALPATMKELEAAIASGKGRSELSRNAREIAQRALEKWLPEVESVAERMYREAMQRFVEIVNGFFERLAETDRSFVALTEEPLDPETGFRARRRFYFNDLFELAPDSAGVFPLARLGSRATAEGAAEYLKTLLEHNATRVVNDLDERVLESRRLLESEVSERLREGLDAAVAALEQARDRRGAGRDAVDRELIRIDSLAAKVRTLLAPRAQEG
jgi:GTP-binding protein EngB required for normal cell division